MANNPIHESALTWKRGNSNILALEFSFRFWSADPLMETCLIVKFLNIKVRIKDSVDIELFRENNKQIQNVCVTQNCSWTSKWR